MYISQEPVLSPYFSHKGPKILLKCNDDLRCCHPNCYQGFVVLFLLFQLVKCMLRVEPFFKDFIDLFFGVSTPSIAYSEEFIYCLRWGFSDWRLTVKLIIMTIMMKGVNFHALTTSNISVNLKSNTKFFTLQQRVFTEKTWVSFSLPCLFKSLSNFKFV